MPLSMQPDTSDPRLSTVKGVMRCCVTRHAHSANNILQVDDVLNLFKIAELSLLQHCGGNGKRSG